jgi:P-type E1-E2 ATPase
VQFEVKYTLLKILDIFFSTVKPAIPICLYTTLLFSIKRLENNKIYTINKFKINEAGRVDTVCFDKTGTLTEEFPKTWAFGLNQIPFSCKLSDTFEKLSFPKFTKNSNNKSIDFPKSNQKPSHFSSEINLKPYKKKQETANFNSDMRNLKYLK